jgi:GT2 family glycosyltransferase
VSQTSRNRGLGPGDTVAPPEEGSDFTCDLSVIIVNYNVCTFLEQALDSVMRAGANIDCEVIVVDNDSVDGSVEMVRDRFPEVVLIVNDRNVGFAQANNEAIRRAGGRYLLILNPDTIVQEDTFETFIRFMEEHPDAGMVGCRILNSDGSFARESRRSFPTPEVAFYKVSGLSRIFPRSRKFGRYNLTYLPENEESEVDALSGSCMFVRHSAVYNSRGDAAGNGRDGQVAPGGGGFFDEDFFMYGEDLDWCFRFRQAGWKVYYTPKTQIVHFKGESTKKGEARYVRLFYGAMSRFVEKHFQTRYSRLFSTFLHVGIWVKATQSLLNQWLQRIKIPMLEFVAAMLCFEAVALVRSLPSTFSFPPMFYWAVAPTYAAIVVASIAAAGGYRTRKVNRQRPAWQGVGMAFLIVTTGSFFIKSVAFSRVVILFGFLLVVVLVSVSRWIRRELSERRVGQRQAVLVGPARAAEHFKRMLLSNPAPPLDIVGYVEPDPDDGSERVKFSTLPSLGRVDQLRDIIRLRHIDDIVFAAGHVSNQSMFALMQDLLDLPIQFKILQSRQTQVLGKAFVGDIGLTTPLLDAESAVSLPRGRIERRFSQVAIALTTFIMTIILALPALVVSRKSGWYSRLWRIVAGIPDLLLGRRLLIGFDEKGGFRPPTRWGIQEGVIPLAPVDRSSDLTREQLQSLYWRYAQSQSMRLDLQIVVSYIRSNNQISIV